MHICACNQVNLVPSNRCGRCGTIRPAALARTPREPLEEAVVDEVTFLDGASADGAAFLPDDIQVHGGKRGDRVHVRVTRAVKRKEMP